MLYCNKSPRATPNHTQFSTPVYNKNYPVVSTTDGWLYLWITISIRPGITAVLSLLFKHTHEPSKAHVSYALHVPSNILVQPTIMVHFTPLLIMILVENSMVDCSLISSCDTNWWLIGALVPDEKYYYSSWAVTFFTLLNLWLVHCQCWIPNYLRLNKQTLQRVYRVFPRIIRINKGEDLGQGVSNVMHLLFHFYFFQDYVP